MTTPRKVLIVDDEPALREVIQLRVESAGHEVVTATNGREALEKARADVPDLIISDVLMPEMDGYTLYKELKADSRTAAIPVLILTARAKMEETFKVVGVDDFIAKPFDGHNLLMKVEHLLQSSRKPREEAPAPDDNVPAPAPEAPVREGVRKVLFAGIDTEVLEAMQQQLKPYGFTMDSATSANDTIVRARDMVPHLLVLDALMAGAEAGGVVSHLKSIPALKDMKIVLYSFYNFSSLGSENAQKIAGIIEEACRQCMEEGAHANIGQYQKETFLNAIVDYLAPEEDAASEPAAPASVREGVRKVLFAGTDAEVLEGMRQQLKPYGFTLDSATSADDIVAKAEGMIPHLLVLDVQMPGAESGEVIRRIKSIPVLEDMKIALYSYYNTAAVGSENVREIAIAIDEASERCLEEGADAYVGRYQKETFLKKIVDYLAPKEDSEEDL
jgi:CheY-like chemotaxis protein